MLFRSVFLKTLRDYRIAILGWGIGLGLLMYIVVDAIASVTAADCRKRSVISETAVSGDSIRLAV